VTLDEKGKEGDSAFIVNRRTVFEHYFKGDMPFLSIVLPYSVERVEKQLQQQALHTEGRLWLVAGCWQQLDPEKACVNLLPSRPPTNFRVSHSL